MRAGKDFMADKPGVTTFEQLARVRDVQRETGRIYTVNFTERFEVRAVTRALELVRAGAIGDVVQTVGLGPHRLNRALRDPWFFDRAHTAASWSTSRRTRSTSSLRSPAQPTRTSCSRVQATSRIRDDPAFEDFGEIVLCAGNANAYIRVDWFTPDGLPTWGDGRLFVTGTTGSIELRKYVDVAGRPGKDHLFLVDGKGVAAHRLQRRRAAVLREPAPRHRAAHADGDDARALLQGLRAGASGAGGGKRVPCVRVTTPGRLNQRRCASCADTNRSRATPRWSARGSARSPR